MLTLRLERGGVIGLTTLWALRFSYNPMGIPSDGHSADHPAGLLPSLSLFLLIADTCCCSGWVGEGKWRGLLRDYPEKKPYPLLAPTSVFRSDPWA